MMEKERGKLGGWEKSILFEIGTGAGHWRSRDHVSAGPGSSTCHGRDPGESQTGVCARSSMRASLLRASAHSSICCAQKIHLLVVSRSRLGQDEFYSSAA